MTTKKPTLDAAIDAFCGAHREIEIIWNLLREVHPHSKAADSIREYVTRGAYAAMEDACREFYHHGECEALDRIQVLRHEAVALVKKYKADKARCEARKEPNQ